MITLSNGVKKPETGEKGAIVFNALNSNFDLQNTHNHNGTNSERIISSDITKTPINIDSGAWVNVSNGVKQTVTLPGTYTLANCAMRFRVRTGANINKFIHPTIIPITLTQFEVIVNDPSLNLEIIFI